MKTLQKSGPARKAHAMRAAKNLAVGLSLAAAAATAAHFVEHCPYEEPLQHSVRKIPDN
ncbi:hypothetical protein GF318_04010 [Candidatus Micrarchaeota archaeon]|nr:hypothetical protein [Candidatus Micrarchaeota archaeon]